MKTRDRQLKVLEKCDEANRKTADRDRLAAEAAAAHASADLSRCENCEKIWPDSELSAIEHVHERVATGEPMPSGQCPDCGAVCHPVEKEAAPDPKVDEIDEAYRAAAKELHVSEGTLEIDDGAIVSRSADGGAYIAAWVWVYAGDAALCDSRDCHAPLDDGEGYNGKCGPCADQAALEAADQASDR
jgi:hypothetical protein